ncbi:MAG: hypothetical protein GXO54_05500 [Chloroflexi bacterium]|nr:hypothetical protein [Chloroflexota bacterium]
MFNIGGPELLMLLILILLLFRPEDWVGTMRKLGALWARVLRSEAWQAVTRARYTLNRTFQQAMREANLEQAWREWDAAVRAPGARRSVDEDVRRRQDQGRIPPATPSSSAPDRVVPQDDVPHPFVAAPGAAGSPPPGASEPDIADRSHPSVDAEDVS